MISPDVVIHHLLPFTLNRSFTCWCLTCKDYFDLLDSDYFAEYCLREYGILYISQERRQLPPQELKLIARNLYFKMLQIFNLHNYKNIPQNVLFI